MPGDLIRFPLVTKNLTNTSKCLFSHLPQTETLTNPANILERITFTDSCSCLDCVIQANNTDKLTDIRQLM